MIASDFNEKDPLNGRVLFHEIQIIKSSEDIDSIYMTDYSQEARVLEERPSTSGYMPQRYLSLQTDGYRSYQSIADTSSHELSYETMKTTYQSEALSDISDSVYSPLSAFETTPRYDFSSTIPIQDTQYNEPAEGSQEFVGLLACSVLQAEEMEIEEQTERINTEEAVDVKQKEEKKAVSRPRRRRRGRKRGLKVWEFLLSLLEDPLTNPSLIKWEKKEEGVFRLVKKDEVTRLWCERRNKPVLSYDHLARAIRYHYTTGHIFSVPEKKLVYKFSPEISEKLYSN